MPAVQKDGDVMVPVEKDQRLLVNNDKERIDKFRELAKNEKLNPQPSRSRSVCGTWVHTEVITETHMVQVVDKLRCGTCHTDPTEQTKAEIPNGHC
mmetsp:Transcript_19592/g.47277  ORF Transcript_19592/g.47277 Transcript_19592/m.47277 type:complete len:96 (+) Transcript_19592:650-937(+)